MSTALSTATVADTATSAPHGHDAAVTAGRADPPRVAFRTSKPPRHVAYARYAAHVASGGCITVRGAKHFDNADLHRISPMLTRYLGLTAMAGKSQRLQVSARDRTGPSRLVFPAHRTSLTDHLRIGRPDPCHT